MSPHVVSSDHPSIDLAKYAVTQNAFLPATSPPRSLSDPYYQPWELIAQHLPALVDGNRIRESVRQLAVLSTYRLQSEAEWRRAYVILAFMAHAYIWGGEEPEQVLPPQITVPLLRVSSHLEVPPVLTYAGANLWNFVCSGTDFASLDELSLAVSFTGTESESWFLLISVAMEAQAMGIMRRMMTALEAVEARDYGVVTSALGELRRCIRGVGALLDRMHERCDPSVFYHRIRPFLAGSMNMEAAGLPRGVFYDQGHGKGEWRTYRGGSNGQSSLIQFFDLVLGVDHGGQPSFHAEVRAYMPGPHRRFLERVARMGSIRELALQEPAAEEQRALREAYAAAADALAGFRDKHIAIVTRYIVVPSRQHQRRVADGDGDGDGAGAGAGYVSRRNLASLSLSPRKGPGLTGTGGTQLIPFLRTSRDETLRAARLHRDVSCREEGVLP
ncbi:uncharacterized protein UV8b_01155 [Ustilaginoidea virens]|uniref:Indoleamine 2,3-dioxygenase n=1 Tax=Ustilaginoidea virens TaxID=1159556 RepID=A0A8E5HK76_USTVR|nr:uncharacterized protein UV8b_01155 [Ustilaginoidea virens]QUC16914.1 hypothetical protein UV8b_01155 [Ustilaginoidea virens]